MVTIGGVTLHGVVEGVGNPPLLLLHGVNGHEPAMAMARSLAGDFSVTVPEHPGWGAEPAPPTLTTIQDLAELYCEWLDQQSQPVAVVGVSCGGWIAAEIACLDQHMVDSLTLISPVGIKAGQRDEREFVDIWEADPEALLTALYGGADRIPRPVKAWSDDDFLRLARAWEATARYCWAPYMHSPKLRARLRRIRVPTLLLSGKQDHFALHHDYYDTYAQAVGSGATHEVIDDVGHLMVEQAPDALAARVSTFVTGLANERAGKVGS
jgi:pimeloyl-ACP methyl ester carboxylesterase